MGNSKLITYDCVSREFCYPKDMQEWFDAGFDERPLWQIMVEDGLSFENTAEQFMTTLQAIEKEDTPHVSFSEYSMKNVRGIWSWYRVGFVCPVPGEQVHIIFTDIGTEVAKNGEKQPVYDELTGLFNHTGFCRNVRRAVLKYEKSVLDGEYAMVYFDVLRFKVVNDLFGVEQGNQLLKFIADTLIKYLRPLDIACRMNADRFVIFTNVTGERLETMLNYILDEIRRYDLPFDVMCNAGVYEIEEPALSVDAMVDRAVLAQSVIKGSYTVRINFYTDDLRKNILTEQEIMGISEKALASRDFSVYYQPQYDYATNALVGAEALTRWTHPERGMISPAIFIPIFEKNGFITKLDFYVFEQACIFLKECEQKGLPLVPISTNFSRQDIFLPDFVDYLEEIRSSHNVAAENLRIEITESAMRGSSEQVNEIIARLHEKGYMIEMDDFGSGYSSLNVLKDIELDVIKLDMMFISGEVITDRGNIIIRSVLQMAKRLNVPVIAEGVETEHQARFLHGIGCDYMQGYLYSKPLPGPEYQNLLSVSKKKKGRK